MGRNHRGNRDTDVLWLSSSGAPHPRREHLRGWRPVGALWEGGGNRSPSRCQAGFPRWGVEGTLIFFCFFMFCHFPNLL